MTRTMRKITNERLNLLFNACILLFLLSLTCLSWRWTKFPMLILRSCEIMVAEFYRLRNWRASNVERPEAITVTNSQERICQYSALKSGIIDRKASHGNENLSRTAVGCMVGWREEEELFLDALRSMKAAGCISSLVVGIDGDGVEDTSMIQNFCEVFPDAPPPIHFSRPLGETFGFDKVQDLNDTKIQQTEDGADLQRCLQFVRIHLSEQLRVFSMSDVSTICIYQPHRSKKDILFTCWLVGIVIAESKGCPFLWSSDSDSILTRGSVDEAIRVLSSKSTLGGVSTRLRAFNNHPTYISRMISAKYWFDQDVVRMQSAVSGCSECQPGPCTAFRIQALKQTLVPWYMQRVLGHRMTRRLFLKQVTNEDRHMTTNLLLQNWEVHYIPTGLVSTESPSDFSAWLRQQLRWSRGTHVERLSYALLFIKMNSWLAFHVWQEEIFPLVMCVSIMEFLLRGKMTVRVTGMDPFLGFLVQFTYTLMTSIDSPPSWKLLAWVVPSISFHGLLKPAVHIWALITPLDSSWGSINTQIDTAVSSSPETALEKGFTEASHWDNKKPKGLVARRCYEVGFIVVWLPIISGFLTRGLAEQLNIFYPNLLPTGVITGISTGISALIWYWIFFRDLYQAAGLK